MLGSIIGDIVGSPFEFANVRTFPYESFFTPGCEFTDDTVCTIAVADALVTGEKFGHALRRWCLKYPHPMGGYGGSFNVWLHSSHPAPYNSWGNGAAMRVSPVGWAFETEAVTLRAALASASPTHNHVEGLIGASCVARAIFRLRTKAGGLEGSNEAEAGLPASIRSLLEECYGPDPTLPAPGVFDETCQGCVPLAFDICSKADSFEDALRRAIVYGGDTDTLCAIVGGIAEARWGIPDDIRHQALTMLPVEMRRVIASFAEKFGYLCD